MGACWRCGRDAGRLSTQCRDCTAEIARQKDSDRQLASQQTAAELEARQADYVDRRWKILHATVQEKGRTAYLAASIYIEVPSVINDEIVGARFDLDHVNEQGYYGWEMVAVVPRTIGVGLKNSSFGSTMGTTWGGGMGGNIAGVYVLLRYVLTPGNFEASRDVLAAYLWNEARSKSA